MSSEARFKSRGGVPAGSSSSSRNEEPSNPQRKNKRYVKKKGETRKRNSMDNSGEHQSDKTLSVEMDKISEKLEKTKIKAEKEPSSPSTTNNNDVELKSEVNDGVEEPGDLLTVEKVDSKSKSQKVKGEMKLKRLGNDRERTEAAEESAEKIESDKSLIANNSGNNKRKEKEKEKEEKGKNFEKGKTEDQKKRDRQTARFAKAVARFSVQFVKAAKEFGIIQPEGLTSESSSSSSDSCSNSCTCSDCCTTESSTCSCSDCRSEETSSSSSSSSGSCSSFSTLNSSSTSTTSSSSSSSSSAE